MASHSQERREPNGALLPMRGEGLGWGIIFLKNKKLHTPPLPLPFMGGELLEHKVIILLHHHFLSVSYHNTF